LSAVKLKMVNIIMKQSLLSIHTSFFHI